jgi:hypothetical protein
MTSNFWIQASNPCWTGVATTEVVTLDEAIESSFPRETEDAILVWSNVYIPLSYKYDISTIIVDVLRMLEQLVTVSQGSWSVEWPSNTFAARWELSWQGEHLTVEASSWRSVVGDTEALLRARPRLELERTEFVREWKELLRTVAMALEAAGYRPDNLPELHHLSSLTQSIVGNGRLYAAKRQA